MNQFVEQSALIIPVPDVDDLVGRWRAELDPGCVRGIPPHITVLFPFAIPSDFDDEMFTTIRDYFSTVDPFEIEFSALAWFDDRVVYLEPTPDTEFRRMTQSLGTLFPRYLPYGGKFDEPTPHLTVGDGAPLARLREAATDVGAHLPLTVSVEHAWLMAGGMEPDSWTLRHEFDLGRASMQN
jgi:2'-5' RNA ligase